MLNFYEPYASSEKKMSSLAYFLYKTCKYAFSRRSRAVTARKCTKKCATRARFLVWPVACGLFDVLVAGNDDGDANENDKKASGFKLTKQELYCTLLLPLLHEGGVTNIRNL